MTLLIAILSPQNGVGKSTLVLNLARAFQQDGRAVLIVDADPQARVRDWQLVRESRTAPGVIGIDAAWVLEQELPRIASAYDVVLIDTAPALRSTILAALQVADFVLIPTCGNPLDAGSMTRLVNRIKTRQEKGHGWPKAAFVIARKPPADASDPCIERLSEYDLPILTAATQRRSIYSEAMAAGMTVLDMEPDGEAASEIRALCSEIHSLTRPAWTPLRPPATAENDERRDGLPRRGVTA